MSSPKIPLGYLGGNTTDEKAQWWEQCSRQSCGDREPWPLSERLAGGRRDASPAPSACCGHAGSRAPFPPLPSPISATHVKIQLNTPSVPFWVWFPQKHPETRMGVRVICGKEEQVEGCSSSLHCPARPPVGSWGSVPQGTLGDGEEHAWRPQVWPGSSLQHMG